MTELQILAKALIKAKNNGFKIDGCGSDIAYDTRNIYEEYGYNLTFGIIFDHDFAKAFFGTKCACGNENPEKNPMGCIPEYIYHLQEMVIEENPIKYLEKFL